MTRLMCHRCRDSGHWRARRDSNPRPSDPKSDAREAALDGLIRAQPSRSTGPTVIDSRVSLMPAPGMSLMPTLETERV